MWKPEGIVNCSQVPEQEVQDLLQQLDGASRGVISYNGNNQPLARVVPGGARFDPFMLPLSARVPGGGIEPLSAGEAGIAGVGLQAL